MSKAVTRRGAKATLYAVSIGLHVALAAGLASVKASEAHKAVAITMTESTKPKPAPKTPEPPKPIEVPKPVEAKTAFKKAAPRPAEAPAPASDAPPPPPSAAAPPSAAMAAMPDFGLAMTGGSSGLAVAAADGVGGGDKPGDRPKKTVAAAKALVAAPAEGACDEPVIKAKALSVPQPTFTKDAQEAGVSGKVRIEISVDAEGNVASAKVREGLGHGLDEAALAAVKGARFSPATRCGKPVPATFVLAIRFDAP